MVKLSCTLAVLVVSVQCRDIPQYTFCLGEQGELCLNHDGDDGLQNGAQIALGPFGSNSVWTMPNAVLLDDNWIDSEGITVRAGESASLDQTHWTKGLLSHNTTQSSPDAAYQPFGPSYCLDSGDADSDGSMIFLWECNGLPQQQFNQTALDSNQQTDGPRYGPLPFKSGKCLDGTSPIAEGNTPIVWECNGLSQQDWRMCRYSYGLPDSKAGCPCLPGSPDWCGSLI